MSERTLEINRDFPKQQSIQALFDVVSSVESYNKAHNSFRELGAFIGSLGKVEESGDDEETTPLERLNAEREQSLQVALASASKAESVGLGLDFGTDKRIIVFGMGDDEGQSGKRPKELRLDLTDAGKLIAFLKSLTPEESASADIQHALAATTEILIRQLTSYYDVDKPDDRLIELIGNAESISNEFKRLNISEGIEVLDQYLLNARRKTLSEFVKLRETESLRKPEEGGFGPAQWHGDMSSAHYTERWQTMYEAIQNAFKNENALPLVNEAVDNLIMCANKAIKDMEIRLVEPTINRSYAEAWPALINIAKEFLNKLEQLKARIG